MAEYDSSVALAIRLITKKGALVTLRGFSAAPPADPSKPWKPGDKTPVDQTVRGVFLGYERKDIDGTRIKEGDQRVLVPSVDTTGAAIAPTSDHVILRGSESWQVVSVKETKPADQIVYYALQVRR